MKVAGLQVFYRVECVCGMKRGEWARYSLFVWNFDWWCVASTPPQAKEQRKSKATSLAETAHHTPLYCTDRKLSADHVPSNFPCKSPVQLEM
mmetsp:Transcript_31029/g.62962  ORF Transcript_31029/g.62962 Transcript_31029/m.62962 type:complete len:92 (+) Transcript_31029:343-618(+)